jgi:hypothetical protein
MYLHLNKSYLSFNRGEDILEINQSETIIACVDHVEIDLGKIMRGQDCILNLVGSIYGRSSIKSAHIVPIH